MAADGSPSAAKSADGSVRRLHFPGLVLLVLLLLQASSPLPAAMDLFACALRDLAPAQLVHDSRYSTADLMAAIEVNDPRTDSFLALDPDAALALEFDPERCGEYTRAEVLAIACRLFQLEATAHAGHPLASTLWTCNLLRPAHLARLRTHPRPYARVLYALLLATVKCTEIVWLELERGNVYQHEDVHLYPSGLAFSDLLLPLPPPDSSSSSSSSTTTTDDILRLLDDALSTLSTLSTLNPLDDDDDDDNDNSDHDDLRALVEFRIVNPAPLPPSAPGHC